MFIYGAMGSYISENLGGNTQVDYTLNIVDYMGSTSVDWFKKLFSHEQFETFAIDAYNDEIKYIFSEIPSMISEYMSDTAFVTSAENNFVKWDAILGCASVFGSGHIYADTHEGEVDYLKQWLIERINYLNERYGVDEPEEPTVQPENSTDDECEYCGKIHSGGIGKLIQFFHKIALLFRKIFG